ncbi:MAG TPA: hypothetical protein VG944_19370 [Fimbriimonas sp.]|nr:hypothetical protein [Fimbriimonas sp.]
MTCHSPIDLLVLTNYWFGSLSASEEEKVEDHLIDCDSCSQLLERIIRLAGLTGDLARSGSLLMVVPDSFLDQISKEGFRVREYAPPLGGAIDCTVTAEDDFLIGRLAADLRGAARIDLCICESDGSLKLRLEDIPFDPNGGSVAFQQSITYAKAAPSETMIARLVAVEREGREKLLGEYTFNHTRTMPGPPG